VLIYNFQIFYNFVEQVSDIRGNKTRKKAINSPYKNRIGVGVLFTLKTSVELTATNSIEYPAAVKPNKQIV
jgi:hypothetical protein